MDLAVSREVLPHLLLHRILRQTVHLDRVVIERDDRLIVLLLVSPLQNVHVDDHEGDCEHDDGVEDDDGERVVSVGVRDRVRLRPVVPVVKHGAEGSAREDREGVAARAVLLVVLSGGVPKDGAEDGDSDEHRDVVAQQDEPEGDAVAEDDGHLRVVREDGVSAGVAVLVEVGRVAGLELAHVFHGLLPDRGLVQRGHVAAGPREARPELRSDAPRVCAFGRVDRNLALALGRRILLTCRMEILSRIIIFHLVRLLPGPEHGPRGETALVVG